jgi:hypothetical protein
VPAYAGGSYGRNIDLAFCCGCSPADVMEGFVASEGAAAAWAFLGSTFSRGYYARWRAAFSSGGPTLDGRFKPDVTAPGVDTVSARSGGPASPPYGAFNCPAAPSTSSTFTGLPVIAVVGDGKALFSIDVATTEPVLITSIALPLVLTSAGLLSLEITSSSDRSSGVPQILLDVPSPNSDVAATWTVNYTLGAGWSGQITVYAADGMDISLYAAAVPALVPFNCACACAQSFSCNPCGPPARRFRARWSADAARQDPRAWEGWSRYKKTRDYQIRAQIWGA